MPKVSEAHLAARRRQIVDAAVRLFARQGFTATSMHQIIEDSGMSAGAVYHYFPTKRGLIEAAGERIRKAYLAPLASILAERPAPPPRVAIEAIATRLEEIHADDPDLTRLGIFVWGEALADPELGETVAATQRALRAALADLATRWRDEGAIPAGADPESVAVALYALMPGFTLQLNLLGGATAKSLTAGLAALS